ncbi:LuxR C-terminal-related transcriptional regulator [Actinomycetospora endophytica]|uniref:LuxR C-terminal-related transcriptional regulator n=1 Tax=Actinomycetospora endophytica TaxID=2291215 RepID=A0ABS8PB69_9PSEU|nr:LuxR C-terminal-related transcriptional regulator [Actinomycetospora endophytica]MCD2195520.1 LuxR C-terminal-related transcriptional regulator [Actinomycetospora endophytica]
MGSAVVARGGEWLDLVADLMGRPLSRWPAEPVMRQLTTTFDAPAGAFDDRGPGRVTRQEIWPPDFHGRDLAEVVRWSRERAPEEHPLLRYYLAIGRADVMQVAEVPDRVADRRVRQRWHAVCEDLLGPEIVSQISLPLGPWTNRAFLVGRAEAFSAEEMVLARRVRAVLAGLDRQIAAHARWSGRSGMLAVATAGDVGLTPRESAVLDLLASGATARVIARRLAVGERTVQKHLQRVYAKLGVADRLGAVQRAQCLGVIPSPREMRT